MTLNLPRRCSEMNKRGEPCKQAPTTDGERCFWHAPEYAEQAKEARRLGGQRRRTEHIIGGSYELEDLGTVKGIRRLLEVAVADVIPLEKSNTRARTLVLISRASADLLKVGELEARIFALEEVTKPARY